VFAAAPTWLAGLGACQTGGGAVGFKMLDGVGGFGGGGGKLDGDGVAMGAAVGAKGLESLSWASGDRARGAGGKLKVRGATKPDSLLCGSTPKASTADRVSR